MSDRDPTRAGEMLEHALDYARRGWPVFPCDPSVGPHGKQPLVPRERDREGKAIPKTGGFYKATTDPEQIREWWSRWPDALIGVRMGPDAGVFAIDPDVPKAPNDPDGRAAWERLVREHGGAATHTHLTPSGGLHVLFRWRADKPVSNREGKLPTGINVRGEGGYVIVPPSTLRDGRSYRVLDPNLFFAFAEAPGWVYALLDAEPVLGSGRETASRSTTHVVRLPSAPYRQYGVAALERECVQVKRAGRGSRNNVLNRAAFSLGTLAGAGVLDEAEIRDALFEAAHQCGLVQEDGPAVVQATIQSGLSVGLRSPRQLNEPAPPSLRPERVRGHASASSGTDVEKPVGDAGVITQVITQDGVANIFAERFRGRLRYCHHTGAWFEWTGIHWRKNETDLALQFARTLSRDASRGGSRKDLKEARKISFASGVERFARGDHAFAVTSEAWDADPYLLATPAGTVDLRNAQLRPANAADGITRLTAVAPAESPDCPLWLQFLAETTGGDLGLVRFLQQWCGYSLTGDTREHALVFVFGSGGNGKTVFLNTTRSIAGDYAATAPMDMFMSSNTDRHPTDLAMLRGARMVTASEIEEGRLWAESRIKQMTGGDPVTARFMRQDFFTYQPQFKLTIVGNHKPVLRNVDDAARRRFNLVPFTRKPEKPDRELEQKLKAEWPAILRWMVEGCLDWQKNGLARPDVVQAATTEYFDDQDLLRQWLDQACDVDPRNPHKWETVAVLFASWRQFAEQAGEPSGSIKAFSERMRRFGFEPHRMPNSRTFRGVRLRPAPSFHDR